jgi:recombination endonuclease VII
VSRGWTCQRVSAGQKCKRWNSSRSKKCVGCGKPRPPRKRPAHLKALEQDYETYVRLNGGERCGICGAKPGARRLHRDHDHRRAVGRGLLCFRCNAALRPYMTLEWLRAAVVYVERAEREAA